MKKWILLGCVVVLGLLLVVFGPGLLDLYRLQHYVNASAEASRADAGPWPRLTHVCTGCHGDRGRSRNQNYPALAGQPAPYIAAQLHRFASGERANPNMGPLARTMSAAEIGRLAHYFAKQSPDDNQFFDPDPSLRAKGKQLVEQGGCAACHGSRLMGHDRYPRLAGQGYDYLVAQLDAFANGKRTGLAGAMNSLAAAASPDERKAMAAYLAGLSPAATSAPTEHQEQ